MQAVGNDFVVIDEREWPENTDWPRVALRLCDRHFGIGSDGLLVVGPSAVADTRMRMFNPDGTEDMCGNGLRCVVHYAHERDWLTGARKENSWKVYAPNGERLTERVPSSITLAGTVETLVGVRAVRVEVGPSDTGMIHTEMGAPAFHPRDLPMAVTDRDTILDYPLEVDGYGTVTVSSVNTGSTHTVIWVDELPDDERFFALSPRIEHHPLFPERTSVLWAKVIPNEVSKRRIQVRIWERGAGETLGCGTGACAIAVLAAVQGKRQQAGPPAIHRAYIMEVESTGGALDVGFEFPLDSYWLDDPPPSNIASWETGKMELSGYAQTVYSGKVAWNAEG